MSNPTCPQCDCVAGCQSRERLCPNVAQPDVTFIDKGNKAQPTLPPLPAAWEHFQLNQGWESWENVIPGAAGEPGVMAAFTTEQMQAYACACAAIAQPAQPATDLELKLATSEANVLRLQSLLDARHALDEIKDRRLARQDRIPAIAQPVQPAKPSIEIDFKQATELLQMFGDEPNVITLIPGDGHSGKGLYAYYTEEPGEGAEYLGDTDEEAIPIAQPVHQTDLHQPVAWLANYVNRSGLHCVYVSTSQALAIENDTHENPQPLYIAQPKAQS